MRRQPLHGLVNEVLELANTPPLVKTASLQTDLGQQMAKLAAELRDSDPTAITYTDLTEFRRRYVDR